MEQKLKVPFGLIRNLGQLILTGKYDYVTYPSMYSNLLIPWICFPLATSTHYFSSDCVRKADGD